MLADVWRDRLKKAPDNIANLFVRRQAPSRVKPPKQTPDHLSSTLFTSDTISDHSENLVYRIRASERTEKYLQ